MNEKEHIPHPFELFGIECNKGWIKLIVPIVKYVREYNEGKEENEQIKFLQIKEKWGSLNIYTNFVTPELSKLIEKAENESENVCEECGSTEDVGKKLNGWITTMCLDCVKEMAKKTDYPQLWERNSDKKCSWVMPDGKVEEIEEMDEEEFDNFRYGF